MAYNQVRMNVRNFLVGLTVAEIRAELDLSIDRGGDSARTGYIEEYLREVEAESAG